MFRQLGDQRLTSLLNAVREGVLLDSAQQELNARTDRDFVPPDDEFWLTLAPTNTIVTARNRQRLERLEGQEFTHFAERLGDLSLFDAAADDKLTFKVGAQVMMLSNDQSERWVNGTLGRIIAVTHREHGLVASIEFRDARSPTSAPTPGRRPARSSRAGRCGTRSSVRTPSCHSSSPGPSRSTRARGRRSTGWSST
ncbi:hypothetical protein [Aeromicrobium sp. UC242_57]|uniref:hypothetical protein n=1 Tax=Aeromicrobium sp. UC242_57 TaxID=3374624 RepID=UPI003792AC69